MDDEGNELGSGIMELTQTELILHTRKRDAIRWPYLCLRRYGYDSNLFSFESGRRCQTGQGNISVADCTVSCFNSIDLKSPQKAVVVKWHPEKRLLNINLLKNNAVVVI